MMIQYNHQKLITNRNVNTEAGIETALPDMKQEKSFILILWKFCSGRKILMNIVDINGIDINISICDYFEMGTLVF